MNRLAWIVLVNGVFCGACLAASDGNNTPPLEANNFTVMLQNAEEIALAKDVDRALQKMVANVSACSAQKIKTPQECVCAFPSDMGSLRKAVDVAVQKHAAWKDKAVSFRDSTGSHTISIPGLERQLAVCQ